MQPNTSVTDKRAILRGILNEIEPGWTIKKPDLLNPADVETLCIFQNIKGYRQAEVSISNEYFQDASQHHKIRPLVEDAIRNAWIL